MTALGSLGLQNGVLAALCNAMGVPVPHFGDEEYGGELTLLRG